MHAGNHFQAAVFLVGLVNGDHRGDMQVRVNVPSGLNVLVLFEPITTRQFEVDLILEQHGLFAKQLGNSLVHTAPCDQFSETLVERHEVLDPAQYARSIVLAFLEVLPILARDLRGGRQFVGPAS